MLGRSLHAELEDAVAVNQSIVPAELLNDAGIVGAAIAGE